MTHSGTKKDKNGDSSEDLKELLKEFDENPYDPAKKTPEDVMRIFFETDVKILPVVSRRNILIGLISREDIVSEMSDIDRVKLVKIDRFITKIAKKMPLEDLLPFVSHHKEFEVINIFGETQGKWSRLDLIAACENPGSGKHAQKEIENSKEEQIMEWIIYLILENIPRALYAVNLQGKTIFYNSYFEELLEKQFENSEFHVESIEDTLKDTMANEFYFTDEDKNNMYFYNKKYNFYYEKVPMNSNGKKLGFLIYVDDKYREKAESRLKGLDQTSSLSDKLDIFEKQVIQESLLNNNMDIVKVARELKLTKNTLKNRIKKLSIKIEKGN